MKIGIIGAGISGLSAGRLLAGTFEVEILEKEPHIGGIAWVKMVGNIPYHTVGGHCLNSNNARIMNFIFETVLAPEQWHRVQRIAKIALDNHLIDYPIEFSVPQIATYDEDLAYRMTYDFLTSDEQRPTATLEDWFRVKFGNTLAEKYFIPYNSKIWNMPPAAMSPAWVEGKLPIPDRKHFFKSLISKQKDSMPHAHFYYPNANTQNQFIAALANGLDIKTNYTVDSIEHDGQEWVINGEKRYDAIINTMPLNMLPSILANAPEQVLHAASLLKYNKVTNMLWETDDVEATWTYFPEASTPFHRHIHIGNFTNPCTNHTITEVIGAKTIQQMTDAGSSIGYLKQPVDYNVSDHAYVVFDHNYSECVEKIKKYLESIGLHTLGRFGEWQYYNMDICMESAIIVVENIIRKTSGKLIRPNTCSLQE